MYLRGMKSLGETYEDQIAMNESGGGFELPSVSGVNWGGLFETAMKTWSNVEATKAQKEIAQIQAQNTYASRYPYSTLPPTGVPQYGYSPYPVATASSRMSGSAMLAIGAVVVIGGIAYALSK